MTNREERIVDKKAQCIALPLHIYRNPTGLPKFHPNKSKSTISTKEEKIHRNPSVPPIPPIPPKFYSNTSKGRDRTNEKKDHRDPSVPPIPPKFHPNTTDPYREEGDWRYI